MTTGRLPLVPKESNDVRTGLAKEGRLWGMSAICALGGALTIWRTNSIAYGVIAFLICLAILGGALLAYEKRRKR
jgi:hypothetical protein